MTKRVEQVESTLRRAIAEVLQRQISDPRIEGLVSITQVKVSPDLRDAYVHVSVLPEKHQKKTLYGLRHAAIHIQALVKKKVALRVVPHLDFRLDTSLKKQAEVMGAIQQAIDRTEEQERQRESRQAENPAGEPTPPAGNEA